LARHRITVGSALAVHGGDAGTELMRRANAENADLIVAGAYGHSRARELVFGGVTRTLIAEMTAPVLLSH
jgi:nucleotide-binding universal stress UspA family protein